MCRIALRWERLTTMTSVQPGKVSPVRNVGGQQWRRRIARNYGKSRGGLARRGPAYQMVRITGYKQFPSANIVMWVMNGRALNKHAARGTPRLVHEDPEVDAPSRGSHASARVRNVSLRTRGKFGPTSSPIPCGPSRHFCEIYLLFYAPIRV